jgi:hypothetical protein
MSILSTSMPARARALHPSSPGVPWATVATFAIGMSCTSAFWLVSLAGAVGAPARYETPFATWVMLSLVLLPVYGAGVLGALILARRWFGPVLNGAVSEITTGLLILTSGTLLGIVAIAASSAYDYSLQLPHIGSAMAGMASCTGSCIPREQHDVFVLHVRGVLLVSQKLLLTNAVLVVWLLTAWGGRVTLMRASRRGDRAAEQQHASARTLADDVRLLLAGMLAGAAAIHGVVPEHLGGWAAAGWFFVALSAAELVVAGLLVARSDNRAALPAAGAVSAVGLVAWLWSRTLGLPFAPEAGAAERAGVPDVLACALEVGALLAVWVLLRPHRLARPGLSAHSRALVALSLLAVVAIGFAATGPAWFDAFGVSAAGSSAEKSP